MTGFFDWLLSANTIIGVLGMGVGLLIILQAYNLQHRVIPFTIAEKYLGRGQGTSGYKLVGLAFMVFSFFVVIGTINLFNNSTTSPTASSSQSTTTQSTPEPSPLPSSSRGPSIAP